MIVTAANTPNTAPTAAPTGDPASLIEPVLLTALALVVPAGLLESVQIKQIAKLAPCSNNSKSTVLSIQLHT